MGQGDGVPERTTSGSLLYRNRNVLPDRHRGRGFRTLHPTLRHLWYLWELDPPRGTEGVPPSRPAEGPPPSKDVHALRGRTSHRRAPPHSSHSTLSAPHSRDTFHVDHTQPRGRVGTHTSQVRHPSEGFSVHPKPRVQGGGCVGTEGDVRPRGTRLPPSVVPDLRSRLGGSPLPPVTVVEDAHHPPL